MTFWNTGDEEHSDPRFRAVPGGLGLYTGAGSWCMAQVRGRRVELPPEWFIPDHFVRGWDNGRGPTIAKGLVRVGVLARVNGDVVESGYRSSGSESATPRTPFARCVNAGGTRSHDFPHPCVFPVRFPVRFPYRNPPRRHGYYSLKCLLTPFPISHEQRASLRSAVAYPCRKLTFRINSTKS